MNEATDFERPLEALKKDLLQALRQSGGGLTDTEARYFVDTYYMMQKTRVRVNNQVKALERDAKKADRPAEPHEALDIMLSAADAMETAVRAALKHYAERHPMWWFFDRTKGIGPVLAAGLVAHIDITRAPTVGHIWSFAGLDPTKKWEKGSVRPWNAALKTLCWKVGDSFVKVSNADDAFYGKVYRERKAYEQAKNDAGEFADQAAKTLATKRIGKNTDAYKCYSAGKLPPAHIDMRARRYAVKLFLSHLHECWYTQQLGTPPPKPFATAILGHAHYIPPPQLSHENPDND